LTSIHLTLDISQGSVATHLRCDGIFSDSIITNFLPILTVNNCENRLIFDEVKAYKNGAILGHPVWVNFPCDTYDSTTDILLMGTAGPSWTYESG